MSERWPRVVLHADMDAFFAAVEQLDDPALRGKPVIVGGTSDRGVVSTASYEARPFGVGSAMPMAWARRRCPQAIVVAPRFPRYQEVSRQIMGVFKDFAAEVEPLSLDEAFLDMSGAEGLFGSPEQMGAQLKAAVREATGGLTISAGVSGCKYVAKVASAFHKPDGLTVVPPGDMVRFLAPLPVRCLWGVGPVTAERLDHLGYRRIGDVAIAEPRRLRAQLGDQGLHLHALANAQDPRPVRPGRQAQSVGSERTLEEDLHTRGEIAPHLRRAADEIGRRLRAHGLRAWGARVKLKTASFQSVSRQRRLRAPTDLADTLYRAALGLLAELPLTEPIRLVGLTGYDLHDHQPVQLDLLQHAAQARRRRLETTVDAITARYGRRALRRSEIPDDGPPHTHLEPHTAEDRRTAADLHSGAPEDRRGR